MTENETLSVLLGVTLSMAEDIYHQKCLFYNVPNLSDSDVKKCIDEALEALPEVLEHYKKASQAIEGKGAAKSNAHCLCNCGCGEA